MRDVPGFLGMDHAQTPSGAAAAASRKVLSPARLAGKAPFGAR